MAANVHHKFAGVFVIDEGQLRRLNEIVVRRLPSEHLARYQMTVSRRDSYSFSTGSIDEVCAEENGPSLEVQKIRFECNDESYKFLLDIDSANGVNVRIDGDDRDSVFLIYSDIKAYIDQGVMSKRWLGDDPFKWRLLGMLMMMVAAMLGLMVGLVSLTSVDAGKVQATLDSRDVLVKLDYLIGLKQTMRSEWMTWWFAAFAVMMMMAMFNVHAKIYAFFFPSNVFMLGRMIRWYESRMKLRSQIFWSVIVASALGIATSAYFSGA